jgi:uncharacterized metal-binding protein
MVDLPKKKVGIVACSGEELPEGTITRLAALRVLEKLRPEDTVTICLPLFLAGGQGDRAFAKFHPTITIDGCDKLCAARSTEMYSNKPAASFVVSDLIAKHGLKKPGDKRRLDESGKQAVEVTAQRVAEKVDELLGKSWSRRQGEFIAPEGEAPESDEADGAPSVQATCSCGSGIPIQKIAVNGNFMTVIGLPLILETFSANNEPATEQTANSILEMVKIYNSVPLEDEELLLGALLREYTDYIQKGTSV